MPRSTIQPSDEDPEREVPVDEFLDAVQWILDEAPSQDEITEELLEARLEAARGFAFVKFSPEAVTHLIRNAVANGVRDAVEVYRSLPANNLARLQEEWTQDALDTWFSGVEAQLTNRPWRSSPRGGRP